LPESGRCFPVVRLPQCGLSRPKLQYLANQTARGRDLGQCPCPREEMPSAKGLSLATFCTGLSTWERRSPVSGRQRLVDAPPTRQSRARPWTRVLERKLRTRWRWVTSCTPIRTLVVDPEPWTVPRSPLAYPYRAAPPAHGHIRSGVCGRRRNPFLSLDRPIQSPAAWQRNLQLDRRLEQREWVGLS